MNSDNLTPIIDRNELVFYTDKGNIQSGGYKIDNILMNNDMPAMVTKNSGKKYKNDSENVSDVFKDLAIPAGLLYLQQPPVTKYPQKNSGDEVVEDSLYNRLLKMASEESERNINKKHKKTKRGKLTSKPRKTKKHY